MLTTRHQRHGFTRIRDPWISQEWTPQNPPSCLVQAYPNFPPQDTTPPIVAILTMEETNWEQKLHVLTHVLTNPTTSPPLHSQVFVSTQVPCYLNWDYPPLLCRRTAAIPPNIQWAASQFLKRASRFGLPETSWRSKCPYQLPPPLVLAKGVEEARWGDEDKRKYVWKRLRRKRLGSYVNPFFAIAVPNLLLFALLFWDPVHFDET